MKKVIYLYMLTVLVCFLVSGTYVFIEHCYSDEIFDQKTHIEKQLYVKYCSDPLSLNPFDSYSSKLENYIIYMMWILACFNMMDLLIMLGMKDDPNRKPNDDILTLAKQGIRKKKL